MAIATAIQTADRGIGGTGIVGVVTGFGSVFVDGTEIGYDDLATVDIDGKSAPVSSLRAGQLVAIQADGPPTSPHAKTISVRIAAAGRIEALELGSGTLTIAGQAVFVPEGTWGTSHFGLGDWVTVSGLRRADGTIVASRVDPAPPGVLLARGQVVRDGAEARVGTLELTGTTAESVKDRQFVVVSGDYVAGRGHVTTVASDTLLPNPDGYFGPTTNQMILQGFVEVDKCTVVINGVQFRSDLLLPGSAVQNALAVVSLQRQLDGSYTAVGLRYTDYQGRADRSFRGRSGTSISLVPQQHAPASTLTADAPAVQEHDLSVKGSMKTAASETELPPANSPVAMARTGLATKAREFTTDETVAAVVEASQAGASGPTASGPDMLAQKLGFDSANPNHAVGGSSSPTVANPAQKTALAHDSRRRTVDPRCATPPLAVSLMTGAVSSDTTTISGIQRPSDSSSAGTSGTARSASDQSGANQ